MLALLAKYGLVPSIERSLSLFTLSCVSHGYTSLMRKRIGFSYKALAAYGKKDYWYDLINEEHVAQEVENLIRRGVDVAALLNGILPDAKKLGADLQKEQSDPFAYLSFVCRLYPGYWSCIGAFNCFHRYVRQRGNEHRLPG